MTDYKLKVIDLVSSGTQPGNARQFLSEYDSVENPLIADNLSSDALYLVKVLVRNAVGTVATEGFEICKT